MSPTPYESHLLTAATTRALCWRVARLDGEVFGFTDHDRPIVFGGLTYEPRAAFEGSELSDSLGLKVDDQDVSGALSSDRITAGDLARGLYDGARVSIYDVNWRDPSVRALQGEFLIGEVERGEIAFRAELRSTLGPLAQKAGARFVPECSATVGDARCGLDLDSPTYRGTGAVTATQPLAFTASGLGTYAARWFDRGVVTWSSGPNAGLTSEVRAHGNRDGIRTLALWREPPFPVAIGHTFAVRAGCDKTFATCKAKFANAVNFRGFPHMPGEGFPAEYALNDDPGLDGGSRNA